MIPLAWSHWKIASTAVVLGLVGSCAAALALSSAPNPSAVRRAGASSRRAGQNSWPLRLPPAHGGDAPLGLALMRAAASACQTVTYSGAQLVDWWGRGEASASVVQVWHRRGGATLARAADTRNAPQKAAPPDIENAQDQDRVLWVSPRLLDLMRANFAIGYSGRGSAAGRPAEVVEFRRPDGSLAARFWLDAATKLPLRREIFDDASRIVSEEAFVSVTLGSRALGAMPDPDGQQPWTAQLDRAALAALRARGWPLPSRLSADLVLFGASHTTTPAGEVVNLSYSDGLSVVSLFVQRGQLPPDLSGWHSVTAGGHTVYTVDPGELSLAWSARGYVYTVIADAPASTVSDVVAALPHQDQPGFWGRMARGFRRLFSWANPFG